MLCNMQQLKGDAMTRLMTTNTKLLTFDDSGRHGGDGANVRLWDGIDGVRGFQGSQIPETI